MHTRCTLILYAYFQVDQQNLAMTQHERASKAMKDLPQLARKPREKSIFRPVTLAPPPDQRGSCLACLALPFACWFAQKPLALIHLPAFVWRGQLEQSILG